MKKFGMIFAAGALAACMAVGFAACAPISSEAKGTPSAHVTREQWDAFFSDLDASLENSAITYETSSSDTSYVLGIKYTCTEVIKYETVHADGLIYQKKESYQTGAYGDISLDDTDPTEEFYLEPSGDESGILYNRYWKNAGGTWSKGMMAAEALFDPLSGISADYDDYVYSDARSGYVLKEDLGGEDVVLKFNEAGQLVAVWQEETGVSASAALGGVRTVEQMNIVIEYGGQTLTLPEVEEGTEGDVV